jgi:hypothetical protein
MKTRELFYGVVSEAAFYGFIYYVLYLLKVEGNLWLSSLILLVLANIAIIWCPVLGKYCGGKK